MTLSILHLMGSEKKSHVQGLSFRLQTVHLNENVNEDYQICRNPISLTTSFSRSMKGAVANDHI